LGGKETTQLKAPESWRGKKERPRKTRTLSKLRGTRGAGKLTRKRVPKTFAPNREGPWESIDLGQKRYGAEKQALQLRGSKIGKRRGPMVKKGRRDMRAKGRRETQWRFRKKLPKGSKGRVL